jgi:hypothetical protein
MVQTGKYIGYKVEENLNEKDVVMVVLGNKIDLAN